jgi:hypothetical protein
MGDATTHSIVDAFNAGFRNAEKEGVLLVERTTKKLMVKYYIIFYTYKLKMSYFEGRNFGVYVHHDEDPQAHARGIVELMGGASVNDWDIRRAVCDDSDYKLLRRIHNNWRSMDLKYVRQKSGGGCGSGKRFVPVSCSKNCPDCHGCSPGCGRNYEFQEIDGFSFSPQTWDSFMKQFDETRENYIKYRY